MSGPVSLGEPVPGLAFGPAVRRGLSQYAVFRGRASRSEFWYLFAFVLGVLLVLLSLTAVVGVATAPADRLVGTAGLAGLGLTGAYVLAVALPTLACASRRLHDAGLSSVFLLLFLLAGVVGLVVCALPTSPEAVRYTGQPRRRRGRAPEPATNEDRSAPYDPAFPYGPPPFGPSGYGSASDYRFDGEGAVVEAPVEEEHQVAVSAPVPRGARSIGDLPSLAMSYQVAPPRALDEPVYGISFGAAVRRGLKKYAEFEGRASRSEFWWLYLFYVGVTMGLILLGLGLGRLTARAGTEFGNAGFVFVGLGLLFYLGMIIPMLAAVARRLHDAGFSAVFMLLGLVTGIIPLIMCMLPTSEKAVLYGPPGQPGFAYPPGQVPPYGPPPAYGPPLAYGAPPAYGQAVAPTYPGPPDPRPGPPPGYGLPPTQPPPEQRG